MRGTGAVFLVMAIVGLLAVSAEAMTVAGYQRGGYGDFSKAIVFETGTYPCPVDAETVQGHLGLVRSCAIPMRAVGDGSWVCTAVVVAGANYSYWFEYRIPIFDSASGWKSTTIGGPRAQDQSTQRTITVPASASEGYVFYNRFGDQDVMGKQGTPVSGDSWLTVQNPDLAQYLGTTDVSSSGNNDTTDLGGNNNYGVSAVQSADTAVKISWQLKITTGDEIVPTVEGAKEFDTGTYTPYGFRILRARLPSGWSSDTTMPSHLRFEDTVVNQVMGDTLYSPNRAAYGGGYYHVPVTFTDTSIPATPNGDSFVYTVLWVDAYGFQNDTADQNFSGGAARWTRGVAVTVIFLVEYFDPQVVFSDGAMEGTIYLTPYVDGVPQGKPIKTRAVIAQRKSAS